MFLKFKSISLFLSAILFGCASSQSQKNIFTDKISQAPLHVKEMCLSECEARSGDATKCSHCFRLKETYTYAEYAGFTNTVKWICTMQAAGTRLANTRQGKERTETIGPVTVDAPPGDDSLAKEASKPILLQKANAQFDSINSYTIDCTELSKINQVSEPPTFKCEGVTIFSPMTTQGKVKRSEIIVIRVSDVGNNKNEAERKTINKEQLARQTWVKENAGLTLFPRTMAKATNGKLVWHTIACGKYPFSDALQAVIDSWPLATWPTIKDMVTGKPMTVPSGLAWDPSKTAPVKISEPVAYEFEVNNWVSVPNTAGEPTYTCKKEILYRRFVNTSDGKELGTTIFRHEIEQSNIRGPLTNAESNIEEALGYAINTASYHLVGFGGMCWKDSEKKPEKPSNWSNLTTW
jgi:hypothetical protein